jgi:hypothetical protein
MLGGGYNAWRLTALSPLPTWAVALLGLAALAAVALAWRGLRGEARRGRTLALLALRAVSAALAVFLLAEPAIELLQTARVRNRFAVLVDASRSMAFPTEPDGPSRSASAAAFLSEHRRELEALRDRVDLEWYAFGDDAQPTDEAEAIRGIAPRAGRTDLLAALRGAAGGAGGSTRKLAGVLVVSDGADNARLADGLGPETRAEVKALGVPVNAVAVGRSAPRDLAVERIAVDDFAFVRSTVTVEATLRARGFADEEVQVVLRREGAVVASARRSPRTTPAPSSCASSATGSACCSWRGVRAGTSASCAGCSSRIPTSTSSRSSSSAPTPTTPDLSRSSRSSRSRSRRSSASSSAPSTRCCS